MRQPRAAEGCKKKGRQSRVPDANVFTGSNRRAQKRDNSRSSDVSDKMKAHRGEPVNNEADIQADTAVSSKGVLM